jgi:pimeloyl-ACP methyl ester carboxylesterase
LNKADVLGFSIGGMVAQELALQRTLVVNGKNDIMVPTINSYILQQHLPDARLILYPESGHGVHFQFSEVFAEEAARFFAAE